MQKYWANKDGLIVAYEEDFKPGTPGFTLVTQTPPQVEEVSTVTSEENEEDVIAAYVAKFGKKPHHMMKLSNIKKALEQ